MQLSFASAEEDRPCIRLADILRKETQKLTGALLYSFKQQEQDDEDKHWALLV